jgi:hypothetical protein
MIGIFAPPSKNAFKGEPSQAGEGILLFGNYSRLGELRLSVEHGDGFKLVVRGKVGVS